MLVTKIEIRQRLKAYQKAKKGHKASNQCTRNSESCGGCHYWSGAIASLSEFLGDIGIID